MNLEFAQEVLHAIEKNISVASDRRVAALALRGDTILEYGWNHTPRGFPSETVCPNTGITYPWVIHAEKSLINRAARNGVSLSGAVVLVTTSPCIKCAIDLIECNISGVIYNAEFKKDPSGIEALKRAGIWVYSYSDFISEKNSTSLFK